MTDAELSEIEALASAATPGPWMAAHQYARCVLDHGRPSGGGHGGNGCDWRLSEPQPNEHTIIRPLPAGAVDDPAALIAGIWDIDEGGIQHGHDARFIAHARAAVPELVAEVRRLRAREAELEAELRDAAWDANTQ